MSLKSTSTAGSKPFFSKYLSKLDNDGSPSKSVKQTDQADQLASTKDEKAGLSNKDDKRGSILAQLENLKNARKEFNQKANDELNNSFEDGGNNENNNVTLKEELIETKAKLKTITSKVNTLRKEKDTLAKENKSLQEEVMTLQSSLRQMIPGFANTSSSFPMFNELTSSVGEFYKYNCEELFFDLLCPELNMKGIILFFFTSFHRLTEIVQSYFAPAESTLKKTGCIESLDGPIMNVLRKSFQSTWKNIIKQCIVPSVVADITKEIQGHLKLGENSQETNEQITNFLKRLGELILCFYISDPPLVVNYKSIGSKVVFNSTKYEPLDGFIKNKDECIVILPSAHKNSLEGELVLKALVLQVDYEIPN